MQWTFLGFSPRLVLEAPPHLPEVAIVASVSECLCSAPDGWVDHWIHNRAGFFNTKDAAWSVVPITEVGLYELFAYRVANERYTASGAEQFDPCAEWPDLRDAPPARGFRTIGFDLVGRTTSDFFDCSPLTCNAMANEIEVNQFGLVRDLQAAREVGVRFAGPGTGVEPGDYYLVEVLRGDG